MTRGKAAAMGGIGGLGHGDMQKEEPGVICISISWCRMWAAKGLADTGGVPQGDRGNASLCFRRLPS